MKAENEELKKQNDILRKPLYEEWLMLKESKLDYENKVNLFEEEQEAHKLKVSEVLALEKELSAREETVKGLTEKAEKTVEETNLLKKETAEKLQVVMQQEIDGKEKIDRELLILKSKETKATNIVTTNKILQETLRLKDRDLRLKEVRIDERLRTYVRTD